MVQPIHHATVAKAAKLGITITGSHDDEAYTVTWEKRKFTCADAKQGVEDMRLIKMLTLEYPKLRVVERSGHFVIIQGKDGLGEGTTVQEAWDEAFETLTGGDEADDDGEADVEDGDPLEDEEAEEDAGKSVVKRKYKVRYKPFKQTCGDDLTTLMAQHLKTLKHPDTGKPMLDPEKLVRFAKKNGVWDPNYANLNTGMQRMNISNRLRAKIRRDGWEVVWN